MRSIRDFGVLPGRPGEANTRGLQDAIDWASARGGEIYLEPSGEPYPIAGGLVLRENVSILGANGPVGRGTVHPRKAQPTGSVFAVVDDSRPLVTVESSTRVEGIQFWYPEQGLDDPDSVVAYPPTFQVSQGSPVYGVTFSKLTFFGEYRAFDFVASEQHPCELILWEHCYGYPLSGEFIRLDYCYDVPRLLHCHVNPSNQRLIRGAFSPEVVDSVIARESFAYRIDHTDNAQLLGLFSFGTYGGASLGPASYGQMTNFNFDCVTVGIEKSGDGDRNRNWMLSQGAIVANAGYDVGRVHPIIVGGRGHLGVNNVEAFSGENPALKTAVGQSADFIRIEGDEPLSVTMTGCRMSGYMKDDPVVVENPQATVRAIGCIDRAGRPYDR